MESADVSPAVSGAAFRAVALDLEGWRQVKGKGVKVWSKPGGGAATMLRVEVRFANVAPATVYDVLHDAVYWPEWDPQLAELRTLQVVHTESDINYYRAKSPFPGIDARDFCSQRWWSAAPGRGEWAIWSRATTHPACPPVKGVVRAHVHLTGALLRTTRRGGCRLVYVTQTDFGGQLPALIVNTFAEQVVPDFVMKLGKAALRYTAWKAAAAGVAETPKLTEQN